MKKPGLLDRLSDEAREKIESWPNEAQRLFLELLEDARSELQRELLNRALAAGHSAKELHAFADALRPLSDREAFGSCTLAEHEPHGYSVVQLLRAESDPLYAYELKGGVLSPEESRAPVMPKDVASRTAPRRSLPQLKAARFDVTEGPLKRPKDKALIGQSRELGSSGARKPVPLTADGVCLLQDVLNEAVRSLGLVYEERAVDGQGALPLEAALEVAATALMRGVPVPIAMGKEVGHYRRLAVMLQVSKSGHTRAFQLYDPVSQEVRWTNEGNLVARVELPFSDKALKRITRIALPLLNLGDSLVT